MITLINNHSRRRVQKTGIIRLIRMILSDEKKYGPFDFSFILVDDRFMKSLNRTYFGKRTTTDVIAFDLSAGKKRGIEGEIYVNLDQASKQAKENGVTFTNEVMRLAAHGCLHFLGYDDLQSGDREKMLERGEYYLNKMKQL